MNIHIPTPLRVYTGGAETVAIPGATIAEVFDQLTIDKLWLAWTEDPDHDLANQLREKYKDVLLGLLSAEKELNKLGAVNGPDAKSLRLMAWIGPTQSRIRETA